MNITSGDVIRSSSKVFKVFDLFFGQNIEIEFNGKFAKFRRKM